MPKEFLLSSMPKLILAVVLIVCIGAVMGLMGYALTKKQTRVEAPGVKTPDEIVEDETDDWQTYRNEEFGFSITLDGEYKNIWESETTNYTDGNILARTDFYFKDYPLHIFSTVIVYEKEWFIENGEKRIQYKEWSVENNGTIEEYNKVKDEMKSEFVREKGEIVWLKGDSDGYPLGTYLGENNDYVFVLGIGPNGCMATELLCSLPAMEMIMDSFQIIDTSDWQIYRNEEFGFEFDYPSEKLKINKQENSKNLWSLLFFPVDKDKSPEHSLNLGSIIYCNNDTPEHSHLTQHKNFQEYRKFIINIGNLKEHNLFKNNDSEWFCHVPLETINTEYDTKICITEEPKDNFYQVSFLFERIDNKYFDIGEFDKLIRSFKFTDQPDTSDWQTYRNEEFGFEVKYPEEWKIENNILYSSEMYNIREGGPYSLFITIDSSFNSLDEFLENQKKCVENVANFTINNQKFAKYSDICSFNAPIKTIMVVENQIVIGTSYSISDESEIINQILSTFKFIEK